MGERVRERGVSVRLFNLFRLDDFMSLNPLGLMGKSEQLGGWDIPYLTCLLWAFLLFLNVPQVPPTC